MSRMTTTAAFALLLSLGADVAALHASTVCDGLNGALSSLSERHATPSRLRKYARAIAEQKLGIRQLRSEMRDEGCSSGSLVVVGARGECARLSEKLARMEANLGILNEKRISLMTGQEDDGKRQEILAALEQNDCYDQPNEAAMPSTGLTDQPIVTESPDGLETIKVPSEGDSYADRRFVDLGGSAANGSYRTMCVRTCDGGYFPISSHASTLSFRRDAQVCSMMCPGTQTELFYHRITQESASMRSALTGRPYGELENAYRFRTAATEGKSCGCNFSLYYKEMMKREAFISNPASVKQSAIVWIKPEFRGQLATSPGTKAGTPPVLRDYKPDAGIRQIGPEFLPDEQALDLRASQSASTP